MVIVNGDDTRHDLLTAAGVFQQLGVEAGFATRKAMGTNRFVDPRPATAESSVYLLYTAGGQFGAEQQHALAGAVTAGRGLVSVHTTTLAGTEDEPLARLLGSRRLGSGCDRDPSRHTVEVLAGHPITGELTEFEVVDEYGATEPVDDAVTVLARRQRADGTAEPVLHTRLVGAGRVVHLALGHDLRSWGEPAVRALVRRALCWAAGGCP
jgi:hypothetical protein